MENKGQVCDANGNPLPYVLFQYKSGNQVVWITEKGLTLQTNKITKQKTESRTGYSSEVLPGTYQQENNTVYWERIDIELKEANIRKSNIIREGQSEDYTNYFYTHCPDGVYEVRSYKKIIIKEVYKGIDWVLTCNIDNSENKQTSGFKHDFIIHPNADYHDIKLLYKSKTPVQLATDGSIELHTAYGKIIEKTPVSFYKKRDISTRFVKNYEREVKIKRDSGYETLISFEIDNTYLDRERTEDLLLDPYYVWSTYYGGTGDDSFMAVEADALGSPFVTGYTNSAATFPLQDAGTFFQGTIGGNHDVVIVKFNNIGVRQWATYYGSAGEDRGTSIVTTPAGEIYVTGYTASSGFPTQTLMGAYNQGMYGGNIDVFILKFSNTGVRQWATFYGGVLEERANSAFFDGIHLFIAGYTLSAGTFPLQSLTGAYNQAVHGGATDVFILRFNNSGVRQWATYYGGTGFESASAVTCDVINHKLYLTGSTTGGFPLQNLTGAYNQTMYGGGTSDAFILRFERFTGVSEWATYYGGSDTDIGFSIITNSTSGEVLVSGTTLSTNFPLQTFMGGYNQAANGGGYDAFILRFELSGNRLWATYIGNAGNQYNPTYASFDNLLITPCTDGMLVMTFDTDVMVNHGPFMLGLACIDIITPPPYHEWYSTTYQGGVDIMVVYLYLSNCSVAVGSYIGGAGNDYRSAMCYGDQASMFIVGQTSSTTGFPANSFWGGSYVDNTYNGGEDAYIFKTHHCVSCLGGGIALSVENINISATCHKKSAYLEWQTNSNNRNLVLERSSDGISWNETDAVSYTNNFYTDNQIKPNILYYYRLKEKDKDGNYRYSKIVTCLCELSEADIMIYPNPMQDVVFIESTNEITAISMYDNLGRKVVSTNISKSENSTNYVTVDVSHLSKGMYIFQIYTADNRIIHRKVMR
jgi:hypothetical protein